jgi:hypothetical protein
MVELQVHAEIDMPHEIRQRYDGDHATRVERRMQLFFNAAAFRRKSGS